MVSGRRDASTTEDVIAAFVGRDAGNLYDFVMSLVVLKKAKEGMGAAWEVT